jgi:hypothetical protein
MAKAVEEAESVDLAPSKLEKLMLHRLAMNLVRGKDEGSHTAKPEPTLVGYLRMRIEHQRVTSYESSKS